MRPPRSRWPRSEPGGRAPTSLLTSPRDRVREFLAVTENNVVERLEGESASVEKRLAELESTFLKDMDRLDRGILNETEFARRNQERRDEKSRLENRRVELKSRLEADRGKSVLAAAVPLAVLSFLEDFQTMDVRAQKARLQTILKAAHVYKDGRIELEFRS